MKPIIPGRLLTAGFSAARAAAALGDEQVDAAEDEQGSRRPVRAPKIARRTNPMTIQPAMPMPTVWGTVHFCSPGSDRPQRHPEERALDQQSEHEPDHGRPPSDVAGRGRPGGGQASRRG